MVPGSNPDDRGAFSDGFAVPITGLLSVLFALLAGMSVFALLAGMSVVPALAGSLGDLALPVVFAASSIVCFRLRQRYIAARDSG